MKSHNEYTVYIHYLGRPYKCDIVEDNVTIEGWGPVNEYHYAALRNYLEDEGFIKATDERKGILDQFKTK
jgi:hypothetical protein